MGTHSAQQVTVIEENGSWIRIRMGAGFQWVNKNQLNPVKQGNFLEGKAIIIDPGHGGVDSGNPGYYEKESETVLDVSLRLQKIFEKRHHLLCYSLVQMIHVQEQVLLIL